VTPEMMQALQDALMEVNASAPDLAKSVGMNGFERASDADWDDVRSLNLTAHETGITTERAIACPSV